jgi:hypothetical protein
MGANSTPYDRDFYAWSREQAALLRDGRLSEADLLNIAEEIDSMGRSESASSSANWSRCCCIC